MATSLESLATSSLMFPCAGPASPSGSFNLFCCGSRSGSVLIQRYGVNAEESRGDPGRDDVLRLEDVEHGGVHYPERNGISRLDEMMMSGVVKVDMIIE